MKTAIIGAGAAGCFAAANIPRTPGHEVVIFEKTGKALQKVKASGGGRCNVTHHCFDIPELVKRYPRGQQFLKRTLHTFGPKQTIEWFEKRGVKLKTEDDGRMFPVTDNSQTIIDCIWQEMMRQGVQVYYHKSVQQIIPGNSGLSVTFADGDTYIADNVLIATGGFPKPEQYKWIEELGHHVEKPVPSLFTFNMPRNPITELMGVSVANATIKIAGTKFIQNGPLLITHWGMSGPAILKTSAFAARELAACNYEFKVLINWLGNDTDADLKETLSHLRAEQGKQLVTHKNPFDLPRRLWEFITARCGIPADVRWGELSSAAQNKLVANLRHDQYTVSGKTTFKEEFVTCGGVHPSEVDAQTMQSRIVPHLFFAGEILNVDGITGGYNFQHAWSSAFIAAHAISSLAAPQYR